jgi:hypothetical protein
MKRLLFWMTALGGLTAMVWHQYPALQRYMKIRSM